MRRTFSYTVLFLIALQTGCAGIPPEPPPLPFEAGLEWIVLLLVVMAGVLWASRMGLSQYWRRGTGTRSSRAYEVLRERYAKGEIAREEYLRMASDLEAHEHVNGR